MNGYFLRRREYDIKGKSEKSSEKLIFDICYVTISMKSLLRMWIERLG
jgi:hypothetical protein